MLALVCSLPGCGGAETTGGDAPVAQAAPATAGARVQLALEAGGGAWLLLPKGDGDGYKIKLADRDVGKLKIEADRVKYKDAADALKAKVKRKDDGFKVYNPDDSVALKVKVKGDGYKLKGGDDQELGRVEGSQITLTSGAEITLEHNEGRWIVRRDGAPEGGVSDAVTAGSAVFLGLTELTLEQRIAAMVFHHEFHGAR